MHDGGRLTIETANAYLDEAYARDHVEVDPGQFVDDRCQRYRNRRMPPDVAARAFDPFFTTR